MNSYPTAWAPKIILLKKTAACSLLFSFAFSPFLTFAQEMSGSDAAASQTDTSSSPDTTTIDTPSPTTDSDESDGSSGTDTGVTDPTPTPESPIPETPTPETPAPDSDSDDASVDDSQEKPTDDEKAPEVNAMAQGTSQTEAGSLFINTETTHSASPEVDTQTGALKYEYPISIPPGRAGAVPDLKLQYDSNNTDNNNLFGYGWSLSTPSITRINKHGTDVLFSFNDFSSSLDGDLVKVGTSTTYKPRVENGSFRKYTFSNNVWTVTEKDGTTMLFGTTTSARRDDPSNSSRIYSWQLEESRDTNDNFVSYQYFKDAGQIYPDRITYSGHASTTGPFTIQFSREVRSDNLVSNQTGFTSTTTYRTNRIEAQVSGSWVFRYDLTYTLGHNGNRSILSSVTKSGKDDSGNITTIPSTNFTYESYSGADKGWANTTGISVPVTIVSQKAGYDQGSRFVDINGDGLPDIINNYGFNPYPSNTPPYGVSQGAYLNNGNGWATTTAWTIPQPFGGRFGFAAGSIRYGGGYTANSVDLGARFADVNNDGYTDIVWAYHTSDINIPVGYSYDYTIQSVYINNKVNGWATTTAWTLPSGFLFGNDVHDSGGRVIDINGDHLPDLISSVSGETSTAYLNTGSGWVSATSTWSLPEPISAGGGSDSGTRIVDVNGDGLPDILRSVITTEPAQVPAVNKVYLNTGSGWSLSNWTIPVAFASHISSYSYDLSLSPKLVDVNGDGLTDIIRASQDDSNDGNDVYINTGKGWTLDSSWNVPLYFKFGYTNNGTWVADAGVAEMDLDGDNMIDFVKSGPTPAVNGQETWVYLNRGKVPDLLSSIEYPEGGKITTSYKQSDLYQYSGSNANKNLSSNLNTIDSVTFDDDVTSPYTHTYTYGGGVNYYASSTDTKFAGFATTTMTDSNGNVTSTFIHQGNNSQTGIGEYADSYEKIGKPFLTEIRDSSGNLYNRTISRWESQPLASSSAYVYNTRQVQQQYDGDSDHKDTASEYTYGPVGNILTSIDWGEVTGSTNGSFTDTGSDKRTTTYQYASSTNSKFVAPSKQTVTDQSLVKVKESNYYYDNQALGGITLGNLTQKSDWATSTTYADNKWVYDSFGMALKAIDSRNATTTYAYDTYNLYPVLTTNPLLHTSTSSYDYTSGKTTSVIDNNGYTHESVYDGLDRLITKKEPDPVSGTAVTVLTSAFTDTRGDVSTLTKNYLSASSSIASYQYADGFGRTYQQRDKAEDPGVYIVHDSVYGKEGLLSKESLPYFDDDSNISDPTETDSLYIKYYYDSLGRKTSIQNAVNTTSTSYDQWKQTVVDSLSHSKEYQYDAFGRLGSVYEHNATSTFTTSYTWNPNDLLTKITDALGNILSMTYDGLGRRISAQDLHASGDATFGTWQYAYDNSGNLIQVTDPKSQVVQKTYDLINRQLTDNYTGTAGVEQSYKYDSCTNGIGKLCIASSTTSTSTYTYTPNGLTKSETKTIQGTNYLTQYLYDLAGNQLEITYPDNSAVRYTYNAGGKTETVERKEAGGNYGYVVPDIDYGPNGLVSYQEGGDNTYTANSYNPKELYRLERKVVDHLPDRDPGDPVMMRSFGSSPQVSQAPTQEVNPLSLFTPDGFMKDSILATATSTLAKSLISSSSLPTISASSSSQKIFTTSMPSVLQELKALPLTDKRLQFKAPIENHLGMKVVDGIVKYAYKTDTIVDSIPVGAKTIKEAERQDLVITGEVVDKRTKFARTFATDKKGMYVTEIGTGDPTYYQDESGTWWLAEYGVTTKESYDYQVAAVAKEKLEKETLSEKIVSLFKTNIAHAATGTFYPDPDPELSSVDGELYQNRYKTWWGVHDASTAFDYWDYTTSMQALDEFGNARGSTYMGIRRTIVTFDTSSIPDTATITGGSLDLYVLAVTAAGPERRVYVVSSYPGSNTALTTYDYPSLGSSEFGVSDGNYTVNTYESIPLNTTGLAYISKTGVTDLGVRTYNDFKNIATSNYSELMVQFASSETSGTSQDPKLVVIYNIAPGIATSLQTESQTNPTAITDSKPDFSSVFVDPDSGDYAISYDIQVSLSGGDWSNPVWDSGKRTLTTTVPNGFRSQGIEYEGPKLSPEVTYFWRMKYWDSVNTPGSWSTTTDSFSLAKPAKPLMDNVYTYDPIGNVKSITDIRDQAYPTANVYSYDDLYRLTSVGTTTATLQFPNSGDTSGEQSIPETITIQPDSIVGKDTTFGNVYDTGGVPDNTVARIGGWGDEYLSYIQFPLDQIADLDEIDTAQMYLFNNLTSNPNQGKLLRITQDWTEAGVNLANNPASTDYGMSWQPVPDNNWWITDVTQLTKDWKKGVYPNYGVKIVGEYNSDANYKKDFWTSDYTGDVTEHPKLIVSGTHIIPGSPSSPGIPDVTLGTTTAITNSYTYNAIGDILSATGQGAYTYAGTGYANPHAVTNIASSTTYGYDADGNLTSEGSNTYTWNYKNQLTGSTIASSTATYAYDHTGQRVSQTRGGITTVYPNNFYEKTGTSTLKNIYVGDQLVAMVSGTGTSTASTTYIHADHLGSTRLVTDSTGNVIQALSYTPFGSEAIATGTPKTNRHYIGQVTDSSSLSYLQNRYYSGQRGQFISQDPVFLALGSSKAEKLSGFSTAAILSNPQSMNSYSYASNNPITRSDPSGLYDAKNGLVQKGDTLSMITQTINGINKTNYTIAQIAKLNGIGNPDLIKSGQQIIPNMTWYPDVSNSLTSIVKTNAADKSINSALGPVNFYKNVKTGGPQDYKNQPGQFNSQTHTGFVFNGSAERNDFPANFNFGYVGASTWWGSDQVLQSGAGGAQVVSNLTHGSSPAFNSPYLDNPGDSAQIMQGINYYNNGF